MSIIGELRRRSVFRVAATYVVATWLIIQVVATVSTPLSLPEWFETVVIVSLAIGFPIAILLAWAFELTPDGIRVTPSTVGGGERPKGNAIDYVLAGVLVFIALAIVWPQGELLPDESKGVSIAGLPDKSIAVLPFIDLSPDGDQQHFADGIAEELLNELNRLEGLSVAGRTSSFAFRDRNEDLRKIGESLSVSSILEGSIRRDKDRIRITAQLINAADGYHLWSRTYEREIVDIFTIQEQIAAAVAGALGVSLGVGDVNSFRGAGTNNVEAYDAYLQVINSQDLDRADAIRMLERAVRLDPGYAAAWAALGLSIGTTMWISPVDEAPEILDRAIPHLLRAVELESDSAYAYTLLATVNYARLDWIQSEDYYSKASGISFNGSTLYNYGNMLMRAGRSTDAIRIYEAAATAERHPVGAGSLSVNATIALRQFAEARNVSQQMSPGGQALINYLIALNEGDPATIMSAIAELPQSGVSGEELFGPVLRAFESAEEVRIILQTVYGDPDLEWPSKFHDIALVAAYFGDPELSLEAISVEARLTTIRLGALWYPVMSQVRQLPAFAELVTDINLYDYWQAYGWSDFCRPTGDENFKCN